MGLNFDTMRLVVLAFVVLAVAAGVNAALGATQLPHSPFHGKKTLVLLDTMEEKRAFSIYFSALEKKGYELTFARADDASLSLVEFGEYLFDSLILFAPQTSRLGGGVGVGDIMEFVRSGRSVVLAGSSDIQLEFQMLDPYVRLTMPHDGAGNYVAAFKVPDVYGVFQFKLNYRRHGYSSLSLAE